jgi:hypothetical protein
MPGVEAVMTETTAELWQKFDRELFGLKIREPMREIRSREEAAKRRIEHEVQKSGNAAGLGPRLMEHELQMIREIAGAYDKAAREVWVLDGNPVTPAFVRMVFQNIILPIPANRRGCFEMELRHREGAARRFGPQLVPLLGSFARNVKLLTSELAEEYEIEARTLAKQVKLPAAAVGGVAPARAGRPVSKVPSPITELRGSYVAPAPESTRMLTSWPHVYPNGLQTQTTIIISEALEKFPRRTDIVPLCRHVVSQLSPRFCEAVRRDELRRMALCP